MKGYFLRLSLFVAIGSLPFVGMLVFFQWKGFEPILTESISFDIKLNEVKKRELGQVDVMAIGSSICLNDLHGPTLQAYLGEEVRYYNFASWGVTMGQNLTELQVFLRKYQPKVVLIVSTSTDFESPKMALCSENELNLYLKKYTQPYFFLRELDFFHLLHRYKKKQDLVHHPNNDPGTAYQLDQWGGANLVVPPENRVKQRWDNETLSVVEEAQYGYLEKICQLLTAHNIPLVFVQPPMKYGNCSSTYCQEGLRRHLDRTRQIVESQSHRFVDLYSHNPYPDSLFSDEQHLNFEGPARFTGQLLEKIDLRALIEEASQAQNVRFSENQ